MSVVSHAQLKFIANVSEVVGYDGDFWTGLNDQKFEGNKKRVQHIDLFNSH